MALPIFAHFLVEAGATDWMLTRDELPARADSDSIAPNALVERLRIIGRRPSAS